MPKKSNQRNPLNGYSNKRIAIHEKQNGVEEKKEWPLSAETASQIYFTLYSDSEEKRTDTSSGEIDDEAKALITEIQYRPIEDIVRYGSCVSKIDCDEEQARAIELNGYLNDAFNLELYHDMMSNSWGGLFNPLEFFKIFQAQYKFVATNLTKPLAIKEQLRQLKLDDHQKLHLLQALTRRLKIESEKNGQFKNAWEIAQYEWKKHWRELNQGSLDSTNEKFHFYNIFALQSHLQTSSNTKAKIEYLIKLKAELQQLPPPDCDPFFVRQVDIEIEKLKQLQALEKDAKQQVEVEERLDVIQNKLSLKGSEPKHQEFTTTRQVIALYYMLKHLEVNIPNTVKANFIEFLTRRNNQEIRERLGEGGTLIHKNKGEDAKYVKSWFQQLGLTEIAKNMDEDLKKSEDF